MQIEFLQRNSSPQFTDEFADYVGQPQNEVELFLEAAIQHVELATLKSLTEQKIKVVNTGGSFVLPYGPINEIEEIKMIGCDGNKKNIHPKNCRLAGNKILLPKWDYDWEITYTTKPINIGPIEKIEIYKIGEMLIDGECVKHNKIRQSLNHLKSKLNVSVQLPT